MVTNYFLFEKQQWKTIILFLNVIVNGNGSGAGNVIICFLSCDYEN